MDVNGVRYIDCDTVTLWQWVQSDYIWDGHLRSIIRFMWNDCELLSYCRSNTTRKLPQRLNEWRNFDDILTRKQTVTVGSIWLCMGWTSKCNNRFMWIDCELLKHCHSNTTQKLPRHLVEKFWRYSNKETYCLLIGDTVTVDSILLDMGWTSKVPWTQ